MFPHLANTPWSYAVLKCCLWPLLDAIASSARKPLDHVAPGLLANTLWAISALPYQDVPLMKSLSAESLNMITASIDVQSLANTAWSEAHLDFQDGPLRHALASSSRPR